MKKYLFVFAVLTIMVSCVTQNNLADNKIALKDFAELDQKYIPALALTSVQKVEPSRKALNNFKTYWNAFEKKYSNPKLSSAWRKLFATVDEAILEAEKLINIGTPEAMTEAHEELEVVRYDFFKTRRDMGIDYYIDYLTDFHTYMEIIVLKAKDKSPEDLTPGVLRQIVKAHEKAESLWSLVESQTLDSQLFRFSPEKTQEIKKDIQKEGLSLSILEAALEQLSREDTPSNRQEVIKKAVAIKPGFAKIFKSFGDFKL